MELSVISDPILYHVVVVGIDVPLLGRYRNVRFFDMTFVVEDLAVVTAAAEAEFAVSS